MYPNAPLIRRQGEVKYLSPIFPRLPPLTPSQRLGQPLLPRRHRSHRKKANHPRRHNNRRVYRLPLPQPALRRLLRLC